MRHLSVLQHGDFRYLKASLGLSLAALAAYLLVRPAAEAVPYPFGATTAGYVLGISAAVLMLVLTLFGLRKRRYAQGRSNLAGWLSAHIYLGLAIPILATLHCGFSFGWNVHTTCYGLMLGVVASGLWGVYRYVVTPPQITANLGELTLAQCLANIQDLDRQIRRDVLELPDDIIALTERALERTQIGGGVWAQWRGAARPREHHQALSLLEQRGAAGKGEQGTRTRDLFTLMQRRTALVERARRDIQLRARVQFWLIFHVPLTGALWVALGAHVLAVLYYW